MVKALHLNFQSPKIVQIYSRLKSKTVTSFQFNTIFCPSGFPTAQSSISAVAYMYQHKPFFLSCKAQLNILLTVQSVFLITLVGRIYSTIK